MLEGRREDDQPFYINEVTYNHRVAYSTTHDSLWGSLMALLDRCHPIFAASHGMQVAG